MKERKNFFKFFFVMTSSFQNGAPFSKKLILAFLARCTASGLDYFANLLRYCRKRIQFTFRIWKQNLKILLTSRATAISKIVIFLLFFQKFLIKNCWRHQNMNGMKLFLIRAQTLHDRVQSYQVSWLSHHF